MLPNNQGYTMSDISWERAKQLGKEELAQHRTRIDKQNNEDWEVNERKYAQFCRINRLETFQPCGLTRFVLFSLKAQ